MTTVAATIAVASLSATCLDNHSCYVAFLFSCTITALVLYAYFADLFNICEHSWMLHETKNKNWKTTIKGFKGIRCPTMLALGSRLLPTDFWCWFKTSVLPTQQSFFWCWFKTSVLPTQLYLPPGDSSVMYCLLDNSVHCPCDNKHVSVTYALSSRQFVYCPCDNKLSL
jgi:hypothetical protein